MSRYDDALWEAADRHMDSRRPSGEMTASIERPVPHVGDEWDGWREYAVKLTLDEGVIARAEVIAELEPYRTSAAGPLRHRQVPCVGGDVSLTQDERESLEVSFSEDYDS